MNETEAQRLQREQIARQLRLLPRPAPCSEPPRRPWPPNLRLRVLAALEQVRQLEVDAAVETLIALDLELGLLDADLERTSAEWAIRCIHEERSHPRLVDDRPALSDADAGSAQRPENAAREVQHPHDDASAEIEGGGS